MFTLPQWRMLLVAAAIIASAVTAILLLGPGREARQELNEIRDGIARQIEITSRQLQLTEEQHRMSERQLEIAESQLALTEETVRIQRELLQTLELQRRLLDVAESMLREVREINRKMPPQPAPIR